MFTIKNIWIQTIHVFYYGSASEGWANETLCIDIDGIELLKPHIQWMLDDPNYTSWYGHDADRIIARVANLYRQGWLDSNWAALTALSELTIFASTLPPESDSKVRDFATRVATVYTY